MNSKILGTNPTKKVCACTNVLYGSEAMQLLLVGHNAKRST